jgi:catechol-2,3-dioxygenase
MPVGHIDLRVGDLATSEAFYDRLLPQLGYTERFHGGDWRVWAASPTDYFAVTQSDAHVPNENRIAFAVGSRDEVDAVATLVGAPAKEMPYGPGYYAVYFDDPAGNPLEVYVR